jgi:hypothetical protein
VLRTRLLITFTALATLGAVALSACDSRDGGDANNLSKAQFASKANAICAEAQPVRARLLQQLPAQPSGQADAGTFELLAGSDHYLIRHVDALVPPEDEQDRVDRILDGWRRRAKLEERNAMQPPQRLETFTAEVAQIDAATDPVAVQLGLTACTHTS